MTLADLFIAPQLDIVAETPEWAQLSARAQNLVDWLERMNARTSLNAMTWDRMADFAKAA